MPTIIIPKFVKKQGEAAVAAYIEAQKELLGDPSRFRADIHVVVRDVETGASVAEYDLKNAIQYGVWGFTQDEKSDESSQGFGFDFLSTRENGFQAHKIIEERWLYSVAKNVITKMAMRDHMQQALREGGKKVIHASAQDLPPVER